MNSKKESLRCIAIICLFMLLMTACAAGGQGASSATSLLALTHGANAKSDDIDAYVGCYANGNDDVVYIEKSRDGYTMSVALYRLTTLDEGKVSVSTEGIVFQTVDAAENPMTVTFRQVGDTYALRVEESTWPLLEQGTVIDGFVKTTPEALAARFDVTDGETDASDHLTILPPYGEGQIGLQAVVLCESLTVRQEPRASSRAVKTLHHGDYLTVYQQANGWAQCFLSDDVDAEPAGWVNSDYIIIDPAWCLTKEKTPVYAWNDTAAPKVALLDANTTLPILKVEGDWLIVSLRGATGWIHK